MTIAEPPLKRTPVGIGQLAVSRDPREVLVAYGLGSCVALTAYDPRGRVGGMAHVLLPHAGGRGGGSEPARFADIGVGLLIDRLREEGASLDGLVLTMAGGAAVLGAANAEKFKIGERNAEAIKEQLAQRGLSVAAEDIGGGRGRTLEFHVGTGETRVRTAASAATVLQGGV